MFCSNCGAQLKAEARFCAGCGHPRQNGSSEGSGSSALSASQLTAPTTRQLNVPSEALQFAQGWRGAAIGAVAAFGIGVALAIYANIALIAGVSGAGFILSAALSIFLYGSLGVPSVGSTKIPFEGSTVHYSVSLTLIGGLIVMLLALGVAGWLGSRHGAEDERGTVSGAAKTAVLFAAVLFIASFFISYASVHPGHFRSLLYPLLLGFPAAVVGAQIERDGRGFWRAPVGGVRGCYPEVVQALGAGLDALVRSLLLCGAGVVVVLLILAAEYPHIAGLILGQHRFVGWVLLAPFWLPHLVAVLFVAAQGIAFHIGATGTAGTIDAMTGGHATAAASIFGASHGGHVPGWIKLLLAVPAATAIWGGYLAARRNSGTIGQRFRAAAVASTPFVLTAWLFSILIGITFQAGVSIVSGSVRVGPAAAGAIFVPLLWGPVAFLVGAGLQLWRAGDLAVIGGELRARAAAATAVPTPAASAAEDGSVALAEPALGDAFEDHVAVPESAGRFCSQCGSERVPGKRFCTSCGHAFA